MLETAAEVIGARETLADHIGHREMLLVFDNFEHVMEAAVDVRALLGACPRLRILVTSREPLRIGGEHAFTVPPMEPTEGVELFLARGRAIGADLAGSEADRAVIAQICHQLDDLPLAIELAAVRLRALSPAHILGRLERRLPFLISSAPDVPERQRTLRAAIDWSHELLAAEERRVFRRLAVFRGGCTLDAAESVCGADLDVLQALIEKSLLRHHDGRYTMLETIHEYAVERFESSGEGEDVRALHTRFFLDLAEAAQPHLWLDDMEWAARLERDHDNLRAVVERLEAGQDTQATLAAVGVLFRFWYLKSHLREAQRHLEAALDADERPTASRAKALSGASLVAHQLGDSGSTRRLAEEALALYRELGDRWGEAYAQVQIGNALSDDRDLAGSVPHLEKGIQLFDELGDRHLAAIASFNLAWTVGQSGDPAAALYENALARMQAIGNLRLYAFAQGARSTLERDAGRLPEAAAMAREAIRLGRDLMTVQELALTLGRLADILAASRTPETAARLVGSSDALFEELGAVRPWWDRERMERTVEMLRVQMGNAALSQARDAGRALSVDEAVAIALGHGELETSLPRGSEEQIS